MMAARTCRGSAATSTIWSTRRCHDFTTHGFTEQPMSTDRDSPEAPTPAARVTHEYKFSHVTIGRYLPTPGKAPGWPFAEIGHWKMDVDGSADDWVRELTDWRREHLVRIGYDDANYRRPELQWAQRNFVHAQMMVEDRYFFDPVAGKYTVDRYLDDLEARFGGIDSVLLWFVYPNIGIDDRNKTDLAHDLPGGLDGLKSAVDDFHRRGVRVFLPTMPWDHGTRETEQNDWQAIAELVKAVGADGINGDTYNGVPRAFFDACDALDCPVVLQPESTISAEEQLIWNVQSWGKKAPNEVIPPVAKWKPLGPRAQPRPVVHLLQRHRLQRLGKHLGHLEPVHPARRRSAAPDRFDRTPVRDGDGQPGLATVRAHAAGRRVRQPLSHFGLHAVDPGQPQRIRGDRRTDRAAVSRRHAVLRRLARRAAAAAARRRSRGIRLRTGGPRLRRAAGARARRRARRPRRFPRPHARTLVRAAAVAVGPVAFAAAAAGADRAHPPRCRSTARHAGDSRRHVRLRGRRCRDRGPDLGRQRRAVPVGGQRAPQPSPPDADAGVLHRPHAGDQRAVPRLPRCQRLASARPAQLPAPLARWRAAAGLGRQAGDLGRDRGRSRLRRLGRQAPAARMGMAGRRAGPRRPALPVGQRLGRNHGPRHQPRPDRKSVV